MARVRNDSEHTVDLPWLGRRAAPDEIIDVPDEQFTEREWPVSVWTVTAEAKGKAARRESSTVAPDRNDDAVKGES